ncbi:MAG: hypothetical protein Nk1A_8910 [Endomicrobiia bacterium]|nr:MAG: hypothetical protein Nk1A_8910 [Endomicrobiia bacterium]
MTTKDKIFNMKKQDWYQAVYSLLKKENLEKQERFELSTKITEIALHLIEKTNDRRTT